MLRTIQVRKSVIPTKCSDTSMLCGHMRMRSGYFSLERTKFKRNKCENYKPMWNPSLRCKVHAQTAPPPHFPIPLQTHVESHFVLQSTKRNSTWVRNGVGVWGCSLCVYFATQTGIPHGFIIFTFV